MSILSLHLVHLRYTAREMRFEFVGSTLAGQEEMLIAAINHFYEVTDRLYINSSAPELYTVYLDAGGGNNFQKQDQIHFNSSHLTEWTVTHELAHSLDAAYHWKLSQQMKSFTRSGFPSKALHQLLPAWQFFWYRVGSPPPPCGIDKHFNSLEDFAESMTAFLFPEEAHKRAASRGYPYERWGYTRFHDTPRGGFIANLLEQPAGTLV